MPTTGVVRLIFTFKNIEFKLVKLQQIVFYCFWYQDFSVIDVGGQRSERRKWIHFFDDVNGIIFVAAISEYDQKLLEDDRTVGFSWVIRTIILVLRTLFKNRLIETLQLFANISNSRYFSNSAMILFLNKIDLFKEKMTRISLKETFPHYKGTK